METDWFVGTHVRLAAPDPERDPAVMAPWSRDSEFLRLMDDSAARPWSADRLRETMQADPKPDRYVFAVRRRSDDRTIGEAGLAAVDARHLDAWAFVVLGERENWDRGIGTEATQLLLRFGFLALNRHRVSLSVFEYNPRSLRACEKIGFVVEGRMRERIEREGRRWDEIFMGILREEWQKRYA